MHSHPVTLNSIKWTYPLPFKPNKIRAPPQNCPDTKPKIEHSQTAQNSWQPIPVTLPIRELEFSVKLLARSWIKTSEQKSQIGLKKDPLIRHESQTSQECEFSRQMLSLRILKFSLLVSKHQLLSPLRKILKKSWCGPPNLGKLWIQQA